MRYTNCSRCDKKHIPVNDTIKIDGDVYCSDCFASHFTDKKQLKGKTIDQSYDPTVCGYCNTDHDYIELPFAGSRPICDECTVKMKNMIMPRWVKMFFIAIIAIVVFSIFWNWRFYEGYRLLNRSTTAFANEEYLKAKSFMNNASEKVPEATDLKAMYNYYNGIYLMTTDRSAEALEQFNKCKDLLPEDFEIDKLIIQAKMGAGFDTKDYNLFLSAAKDNLSIDTTATAWASVASAYACLYAEGGRDSSKTLSIQNLQRARSIDDTSADMKQYYNMIEYRLYSRTIIKREDFLKKFPNGWTKN